MTSRAPSQADDNIVRRFQETGDNECFAELFVKYRKSIFAACHGFFSDWQTAEDATQETFLRAYRNVHTFQGGDFLGWLMRVARNACIDEWRKMRSEAARVDVELAELPIPNGLESSIHASHLVERIGQEIKLLAPPQRQCLELKIQGYSYEETAARTGLVDLCCEIAPPERSANALEEGARQFGLEMSWVRQSWLTPRCQIPETKAWREHARKQGSVKPRPTSLLT